jgi:TPR repeat protein
MDAEFSLPTEIPQKKWYGRCRGATRVLLFTTLISLSNVSQAGVPDEVEGACAGGDDAKTLEVLRAEAEHGDAEAQNSLGLKYYYGPGVPQSFRESVAWYRRSAAQGHADAQHNLGLAYEDGTGVRSLALIRTLQPTTTAGAGILTSPRHPPGSPRARG